MNILERFDLGSLEFGSAEHLHLFVEAARHAFADRYHYMADPDFVDVPLQGLLSKEYARELAEGIDVERAGLEDGSGEAPWARYERRPLHDPWPYEGRPRPAAAAGGSAPADGDCTTHFGVADRHGQPRLLHTDGGEQLRVQGDHEGARHPLEQRDDLVQTPGPAPPTR